MAVCSLFSYPGSDLQKSYQLIEFLIIALKNNIKTYGFYHRIQTLYERWSEGRPLLTAEDVKRNGTLPYGHGKKKWEHPRGGGGAAPTPPDPQEPLLSSGFEGFQRVIWGSIFG